eukprot:8686422-Alexandrium_andersonii.AAC.1
MSASLVGSEMCIRDRCTQGLLSISKRWAHCFVGRPRICLWASEESATAVSYTHLTLPTICSV